MVRSQQGLVVEEEDRLGAAYGDPVDLVVEGHGAQARSHEVAFPRGVAGVGLPSVAEGLQTFASMNELVTTSPAKNECRGVVAG